MGKADNSRSKTTPRVPVVYTMGKVGSSTISNSILSSGLGCHDIHTLDPKALIAKLQNSAENEVFPEPHYCVSMAWRERLFTKPARCFYISAVRDPVERNLSAFFQNLSVFGYDPGEGLGARELFAKFMTNYSHNQPITWFDREWKRHLGIDVYSLPFSKKERFFSSKGVCIFRLDCSIEKIGEILSSELNHEIRVERANAAADKDYAELYKPVKEIAAFTPEYLDSMYDTEFARHFWTEDELALFRQKWLS